MGPKEEFEVVLKHYELMLSKTKYLAGDKMTLADVFHLPAIWSLDEVSDGLEASADC